MHDRALSRLFRRYRDRHDGRALAAVFDATARELLDVACHLIRDPVEAEDLVQATFVTAISKAADYDERQPLKAWLYGILWREAAKARRNAARRVDPARLEARDAQDPAAECAARELPAAVEQALAGLPPQYREVLEPLLREEQRPEEIAARVGRSPGTIRSQIHRGLERLRRALPQGIAGLHGVGVGGVRGLDEVRGQVLHAAGFTPAVAAGASLLVLQATIGGLVMSKLTLGVSAVALAAAGVWFATAGSPGAQRTEDVGAEPLAAGNEMHAGVEERATSAPAQAGARAPAAAPAPADATPQRSLQDDIDWWLARFNEKPDDWRHGWKVMDELAALDPARALPIVQAVWPRLSVAVREQALKPFVFDGGHALALEVLHLGATDAAPSVQQRAFGYLERYAFRDFALDFAAYQDWAREFRTQPVGVALEANARRFVGELHTLAPAALALRMAELDKLELAAGTKAGVDLAATMRAAGVLTVLATALEQGDAEGAVRALRWSRTLAADEGWLRTFATPRIADAADEATRAAVFHALGRKDCGWAQPEIHAYLRRVAALPAPAAEQREDGSADSSIAAARALAEIGDLAAIPELIGTLRADRSGRLAYSIGHFALAPLTGVTWQKGYDAAWWLDWWKKNAERLPPHVRAIPVGN